MDLLTIVKQEWSWTGLEPDLIVGENDFGNLIIRDAKGRYWRLCPEELDCRVIAESRPELDVLSKDQEFLHDWYMEAPIEVAASSLGPLEPGYKYCLVTPGPLGGTYSADNMRQLSLNELVSVSGYLARQIDGLQDGTKVRIEIEP